MCITKYINSIHIVRKDKHLTITIKRSDGEVFSIQKEFICNDGVATAEHAFKLLEEIRTNNREDIKF